jgi:hypothetical protein
MSIFILLSLLAVTLGCIALLIHRNVSESEKECKRYFKDMQSAICNRRDRLEDEYCYACGVRMTEEHAKFHDDLPNYHFGMNELSDEKIEEPSSLFKKSWFYPLNVNPDEAREQMRGRAIGEIYNNALRNHLGNGSVVDFRQESEEEKDMEEKLKQEYIKQMPQSKKDYIDESIKAHLEWLSTSAGLDSIKNMQDSEDGMYAHIERLAGLAKTDEGYEKIMLQKKYARTLGPSIPLSEIL